jgi:hypothetical protein
MSTGRIDQADKQYGRKDCNGTTSTDDLVIQAIPFRLLPAEPALLRLLLLLRLRSFLTPSNFRSNNSTTTPTSNALTPMTPAADFSITS